MIQQFNFTYADFAASMQANILTKTGKFAITGFWYDITETFKVGTTPIEGGISVGNDSDNNIFCQNITQLINEVALFSIDSNLLIKSATDINVYLSLYTAGVTGADLTAGAFSIYLLIAD